MESLKAQRGKLRIFAISLPLIAAVFIFFVISNLLIPSWRAASVGVVAILQSVAAFAIICLIIVLLSELKQALWTSLLYIITWLGYALLFVFLTTAIMLVSDLFGPFFKTSYSYPDQKRELYLLEQDCWIDGRTECPDFHTVLYLQKTPLPFMSEVVDCPCYFDDAPTQIGDKLELVASVCNDQKERTLLLDLETGRLESNSCLPEAR